MNKKIVYALFSITLFFFLLGCGGKKPAPQTAENFLTLADVSGRTSFSEDSPEIRVINIKAKAFIKRNDLRLAKEKAKENARRLAVDSMVRELLTPPTYNRNYSMIDEYMSKNLSKYIQQEEVNGERKIFNDKYYGISASFKVNRQKTLVALQKDLKLINTSANSIIVVITSKKNIDLSSSGFRYSDLEDALMNQIQTDLNQRGLRVMDFRNAVSSIQTDKRTKSRLATISKEQFLSEVTGSSASDQLINEQVRRSESYYGNALSLVKEIAKVVVEVNIFAVSGNVKGDLSLSFNVTAKNISTGRGGAFANSTIVSARRGGPNTIPSAMIASLVRDTYADMKQEFVPQIIKEMSTISVGGKKLKPYSLVMKNFTRKDARILRKLMKSIQSDDFRYVNSDNSVPKMITLNVRYTGRPDELGDFIMDSLDSQGLSSEEPITAKELTDIVFVKVPQE